MVSLSAHRRKKKFDPFDLDANVNAALFKCNFGFLPGLRSKYVETSCGFISFPTEKRPSNFLIDLCGFPEKKLEFCLIPCYNSSTNLAAVQIHCTIGKEV